MLIGLILLCGTSTFLEAQLCSPEITTAVCPTGDKAYECFAGCDCGSATLACTEGFPVCLGTALIDGPHSGQEVISIPDNALRNSCNHSIVNIVIKEFPLLKVISPHLFSPISEDLEEIFIRDNSKLTTISAELFQVSLPKLRVLGIERNERLSNISFLLNTTMENIRELLLAYNNISELPCGFFDPFPRLFRVDLRGNKLISIDECGLGMVPYRNSFMHLYLTGNLIDCNCSLPPLFDGRVMKLEAYPREIICANATYTTDVINLEQALGLMESESICPNAVEIARNRSKCHCVKEKARRCELDCSLWKKKNRPSCGNETRGFEKYEGCVCDMVSKINLIKNGNWFQQYCAERGALSRYLDTMSWKLWIPTTVFIVLAFLIPCMISVVQISRSQKNDVEIDGRIYDEDEIDYLIFGKSLTKPKSSEMKDPSATHQKFADLVASIDISAKAAFQKQQLAATSAELDFQTIPVSEQLFTVNEEQEKVSSESVNVASSMVEPTKTIKARKKKSKRPNTSMISAASRFEEGLRQKENINGKIDENSEESSVSTSTYSGEETKTKEYFQEAQCSLISARTANESTSLLDKTFTACSVLHNEDENPDWQEQHNQISSQMSTIVESDVVVEVDSNQLSPSLMSEKEQTTNWEEVHDTGSTFSEVRDVPTEIGIKAEPKKERIQNESIGEIFAREFSDESGRHVSGVDNSLQSAPITANDTYVDPNATEKMNRQNPTISMASTAKGLDEQSNEPRPGEEGQTISMNKSLPDSSVHGVAGGHATRELDIDFPDYPNVADDFREQMEKMLNRKL